MISWDLDKVCGVVHCILSTMDLVFDNSPSTGTGIFRARYMLILYLVLKLLKYRRR